MADPSQAASVLLKLYEIRTEPELRRARAWFAEADVSGEKSFVLDQTPNCLR